MQTLGIRDGCQFYFGKLHCITIKGSQEEREINLTGSKGPKLFSVSVGIRVLALKNCSLIWIDLNNIKVRQTLKINKVQLFILHAFVFWSIPSPTFDYALLDVPFLQLLGEMPSDLREQLDHTF